MFGAYQAGAWKVLSQVFRPDLIVGASIGAINGWAIAGGCPPDDLIRRWLNLESAGRYRWKFPRRPWAGILDTEPLQRTIRELCGAYQPKIEFAVVVTDLMQLQPRIIRGSDVTCEHLLATTAVVGLFDQVRISGRLHSDGGLLSAVPLWAAAELGATNVVVIDVLPETPGLIAKLFVGGIRMLSSFRPEPPKNIDVTRIAPPGLLGAPLESIYWTRHNAEKWIDAGKRDAAAALKHSIANCFERK
jgi:NTE family protein